MKILYVFRSLAVWGGIERILVDKMNRLATMYDYDVAMLTADQGDHPIPYSLDKKVCMEDLHIRLHQQYQYHGLRRLWVHFRLRRLYERRLRQRIDAMSPDVIVCVATSYADSVLRVCGQTPVVVESHSLCTRTVATELSWHNGLTTLWQQFCTHRLRLLLKRANAIVSLTEGDAAHWRQLYGDTVRVIPNMVHFAADATMPIQRSLRVIFVGRLDYQKQPLEIIRIWKMVQPHFPDWQLDIYGDGEQQHDVENAIRQSGCRIELHKPTIHIFDSYKQSGVLVSTSLFEPFGLVIPEAMSCGLPVVAYDCPFGPSAIITDGVDGFLVENGHAQAFADRLMSLMADSTLRQRMGQEAATSVLRFSAERIMPAWKKLFEEVIIRQTAWQNHATQ